jgi:hypothetical protein
MSAIRVVAKALSHYLYPFVASLLAMFVLGFVSLNIATTYQAVDLYDAPLWQMVAIGLLGFVWFVAALWLAYRKQQPILSANLSLALVLGNALMLEDVGDASSVAFCSIAWGGFSLAALAIYWVANKLNAIGRAKAACAVAGVGSLVFMSLVILLLTMLL